MAATEGIELAPGTNRDAATGAVPALSTPDAFPFPYPKPYDIQLDLMRTVFEAIEKRKIAIVSPA
jgi:chromosome transmission fidelity protein 1